MNTNDFKQAFNAVRSQWFSDFSKQQGYEFNRSLDSRLRSAQFSQDKRVGLTNKDNLTMDDLLDILEYQGNKCPVCGMGFNFYSRVNEQGYNFEISHIKSAGEGGNLTRSNVQLLHKRCNAAQHKDEINFQAYIDKVGYDSFLDVIQDSLNNGAITAKSPRYERYVRLIGALKGGK